MQTNSIRINFGWKSFISFFGLQGPVKSSGSIATAALTCEKKVLKKMKKKIFWKSTKFMFICKSRPWKCKRTEFESILVEKVSFHFLAQGRRRGPVKKSEKNIFWKSTNFMFNSNSRPWKCKRTEFESILVEKVSFHFLAQGHRRGPAKSSEKNIFCFYIQKQATNFMFNSNSRPWKCKRTEFESILVEKVSFHFLAQGRRRGPGEKFWKKYILKIHKYYIHLQKQALKMQTNSIRIDFGWKSFISFFGLRPQARTCEKIWKKYILKIHQFYVQ